MTMEPERKEVKGWNKDGKLQKEEEISMKKLKGTTNVVPVSFSLIFPLPFHYFLNKRINILMERTKVEEMERENSMKSLEVTCPSVFH